MNATHSLGASTGTRSTDPLSKGPLSIGQPTTGRRTEPGLREIQNWIVARLADELNVPAGQIDVHGEITACGLDSVVAYSVTCDLCEWLDRNISATLFWEHKTIAGIARHLATGASASNRTLVALQTAGHKPTLYLVPPAGTSVATFCSFAERLAPAQPVYGVQHRGLDTEEPPHENLEEMAASYVAAIRETQAEGPYFLGGRCFGGIVAYEMAQQLLTAGQEVGLLTIFDTLRPPGCTTRKIKRPKASPTSAGPSSAEAHYAPAGSVASTSKSDRERHALEHRHDAVAKVHCLARERYTPRPYEGRMVVFQTKARRRDLWLRLAAGGINFCEVGGDHATFMKEPHVNHVIETLRACLDAAAGENYAAAIT